MFVFMDASKNFFNCDHMLLLSDSALKVTFNHLKFYIPQYSASYKVDAMILEIILCA